MANTVRSQRRRDALSKERIVEAAIQILDAEGENALTFRTLSAHLGTGSGAIYWHVADKNALLIAATDTVIARAMDGGGGGSRPEEAIRAIALGIFDAIDAHPWIGTQLSREPWQAAIMQIFEAFGQELQALGIPDASQFDAAATLVSYILGLAGQYAAGARLIPRGTDRTTFLSDMTDEWIALDPKTYRFMHDVAEQMRTHDDRVQFANGINIILAGIGSHRSGSRR